MQRLEKKKKNEGERKEGVGQGEERKSAGGFRMRVTKLRS